MNIRSAVVIFHLYVATRAFQTAKHTGMAPKGLTLPVPSRVASSISDDDDFITILGFGSLLSERSSRMTFPDLVNFRIGRVPNYRRVFGHPTSIFFQRGIANLTTLEMSSLSAEYAEGHPGFVCSVFEVPNTGMMEDGVPSQAFLEREEEFAIVTVPYVEDDRTISEGILCTASTDEEYVKRWGEERFEKHYRQYGISTIWGYAQNSGLRPCPIYLRHCVLASKAMGPECHESFLDDTFLVDRMTTLREYLKQNPQVMTTEPPPDLAVRYSG
jgi:hypothetical protein